MNKPFISGKQKSQNIDFQVNILNQKAKEFAAKSQRWAKLFSLAQSKNYKPWQIVAFIYNHESGNSLSQTHFPYSRMTKLLATTERPKVNERLSTKHDLVNWNRQAIMAMIEVVKRNDKDIEKIKRGFKALEISYILYPEYLLG